MFHHRQDVAGKQPIRRGTAERGDDLSVIAIGPIADDRVAARHRDIEDRQAIDIDAERSEIIGHDPRREAHEPDLLVERQAAFPELPRGWIGPPPRRSKPLHAAALLIDENGWPVAAEAIGKGIDERFHLRSVFDVPLEENETEGLALAQEGAFVLAQHQTRAAADEGACHVWPEPHAVRGRHLRSR